MTPCRTKQCETCIHCVLLPAGSDFSQPEGTGRLGVGIIGEASGEMEARDGLPFRGYAPSGSVLERTLRRLGLARDDFFLTNILRCRPWGNVLDGASYEHEAITACEPNLLEVLRRFRPKVLIALGNVPTRSLTGLAGEKRTVSHLRGYVLRALPQFEQAAGRSADDPLLVVPSFHPAFLRRGAIHLTGVLARDIARAVNVRQGRDTSFILDLPDLTFRSADCPYDPVGNPDPWDQNYADWEQRRKREIQEGLASWQARHGLRYNCYPTRREVDLFCRDVKARSDAWLALSPDARRASHLALSYDLETVESTSLDEDVTDGFTDTVIRMSQFSIERGQGLALDWHDEHIQAARWLWKLPLPKCGHNNWLFDDRVLRAVGQRDFGDSAYLLPAGDLHDTLQQFHFHWSDLPAHLQFAASFIQFPFPWKHYNESCTEFYGIADTDACLGIYQMSRKTMEDRGVWWDGMAGRESSGYVAQVEQVRPILAAMEDRGLPINDLKRMGLGEEFDAAERELQEELDERFPDTARRIKAELPDIWRSGVSKDSRVDSADSKAGNRAKADSNRAKAEGNKADSRGRKGSTETFGMGEVSAAPSANSLRAVSSLLATILGIFASRPSARHRSFPARSAACTMGLPLTSARKRMRVPSRRSSSRPASRKGWVLRVTCG